MLNSEVFSHLIVTLVYFLLVSVLRFRFDLSLLLLWSGGLLGMFFLDIDHILYWFFYLPQKEDSKEAKLIWERRPASPAKRGEGIRKLWEMGKLLEKYHTTHHRLYFHTAVFQTFFLIVTFFVLTSASNILMSSFVMSINLHLLKDEWGVYFKDKTGLSDWLFWQVKLASPQKTLKTYLIIVTLVFLLLTFFI